MKFIKKNKLLVIIVTVFVVIMVITLICIKDMFFPNAGAYGNRLKGIDKVAISSETVDNVKSKLTNNKYCSSASYNLSGRIIKFQLQVPTGTDSKSVEELLNIILDGFSDEEKAYYDFEAFITNENESEELYPMIAYKHRNSASFTLTQKLGDADEE